MPNCKLKWVACASDKTRLVVKTVCKVKSCSGLPPVYKDLSTHHDWHVKNAIVGSPIWL